MHAPKVLLTTQGNRDPTRARQAAIQAHGAIDVDTGTHAPPTPGALKEPRRVNGSVLTLIGTGHVFAIQDTVRDAILALRPSVVAVELDAGRLRGLMHPEARRAKGALLHRLLERFQSRIAERHGVKPGHEMLAAVDAAHRVGARVALIDRPADVTLKRLMKQVTWRERGRFAWDLIRSPFTSVDDQVQDYQDDPTSMLAQVAQNYPTVHRIVIAERDELMANALRRINDQVEGDVVAVVGDGHVEGMLHRLTGLETQAYRLGDVRAGRLPRPAPADFSFSVATASPPAPGPDDAAG